MGDIKGWKKYLLIYLITLAASHLLMWILQNPVIKEDTANQEVQLNVVNSDQTLAEQQVSIGYEDIYEGDEEQPPVLLLLPGGPEGPQVFESITHKLASEYRLLIPHLPGYAGKNDNLPSYSFKSSAQYSYQFLEKLDIEEAHVLGFRLGGASAIHLAHDHPDKVSSLGLISSIGVQELELLGSYNLNHTVHGMQLAGVWLFYNAIPHFGLFDAFEIDVSYAKRHYESDQRPIREYLEQYKKPMAILHGKNDPLVPLAAAQEHYRIVPQSSLKLYNADHDLLETHSDSVSTDIRNFITAVENGNAQTAANASKERIRESKKSFSNVEFAKFEGISLLIIMLIIILGTLISEDLTCVGAGLLAARGLIGFWPATLAVFLGIFIGDVGLYIAGRFLGRPALAKAPFKWIIDEEDLDKSAQWFNARGPAILFATRFLPGSRLPTYFSAGVIKAGFWMFLFYFVLSGIIWAPLLVGITQLLGNELIRYFTLYQDYAIWVALGAIGTLFLIVKVIIPAFSYKGRRLLISRYRKITRWQYWWPIIIYTPVVCYILYLGIKYRCLTLFTATNPGITGSGQTSESKSKILDLFNDSSATAAYQKIEFNSDARAMLDTADQFMQANELSYPVVLKPNKGKRGRKVTIIEDRYAMQDYLFDTKEDVIIQEYIGGKEVELYYYREPGSEKGQILSLTKKELPEVTGDGQKTLEELILSDDKRVTLASNYLEKNEDHLYEIPHDGERITLIELGTRSQGAILKDGQQLITNALEDKINEICSSTKGFYLGSLDIKVPDYKSLQEGEILKIIEVNDLTFNSTVIYNENCSFIDGQKELMKQWRLAFKIGVENRKRGAEVIPVFPFLEKLFIQTIKK